METKTFIMNEVYIKKEKRKYFQQRRQSEKELGTRKRKTAKWEREIYNWGKLSTQTIPLGNP